MSTQFLVAFGGNQPFGEMVPLQVMQAALLGLKDAGFVVQAVSRLFRTPCFPAGAGPDYINGAAQLEVSLTMSPNDVLHALHGVEARYGRTRGARWAQRSLDIDLLAMGAFVLPDLATYAHWRDLAPEEQTRLAPDRLILPHPRLQDRAFVLVPLMDIAPDWRHPVSGQTVRQMHDALPQEARAGVMPLGL